MSAQKPTHTFPLPSHTERFAGADAVEGMYPYFTKFRPEDDGRFWFYNKMHFPEPMPAFDAITAEGAYAGLGVMVTRMFAVPTSKGFEHRIVNGRIYIAANSVTDPEEIGRRVKEFEDRAFFYFGNWERLYKEWQERIMNLIRSMETLRVPQLGEFDTASVVKDGRGFSDGQLIVQAYDTAIENYFLMWQYHSEFLILGYGAYLTFFEFCKKVFPEIEDRTIANMVAGVDSLMFKPDDELKRLAARAVELGIAAEFKEGAPPDQILSSLTRVGEAGREWLEDFERTRDPWFNTSVGDGFYHHHRRWDDDLRTPFAALVNYVSQVKAGKNIARPTAEIRAQRDRIISEYRALLDSEADRGMFDQMLGLSHQVFPYVEDHKFYCEHWLTGAFFNKIREFGELLRRYDLLEESEDVFHLNRGEIREALSDLRLAWSIGGDVAGRSHWRPIVVARKQALEELASWSAPNALGPVPESITDPMVIMLWGVTTETIHTWLSQADNPNELKGFGASPGVIEGEARVIHTADDISRLKQGDILVCANTAPSWAPIFDKLGAAVSDIGGTMSHAAIVAREYGLPAVVGTGDGTKRIKDGQRIRVDGSSGRVTILT